MSQSHHLVPLVLFATALGAQNFAYSPGVAATQAGNSNNVFPFAFSIARYQQIHGDLRGRVMPVTELAFRRPALGVNSGAVARTLDCQLATGNADYATSTATFATNFVTGPVIAIARRNLNLPDNTQPNTNPAQFNVTLPFDQPWLFTGIMDLVWELAIHGNTSTQSYILDAQNYSETGPQALQGIACFASGMTRRMQQGAVARSIAWNQTLQLSWTFFDGPGLQPAAVFVGATSADIPVPGLCTNFYVGAMFLVIAGTTNTSFSFETPVFELPYGPNYNGAQLVTQGGAADPNQTIGIPVAMTQRNVVTIPALPAVAGPTRRVYAASTAATTGSIESYPFGLITRFRY